MKSSILIVAIKSESLPICVVNITLYLSTLIPPSYVATPLDMNVIVSITNSSDSDSKNIDSSEKEDDIPF